MKKNLTNTASASSRTTLWNRISAWWNHLNNPERIIKENERRPHRTTKLLLEDNVLYLIFMGFALLVTFVSAANAGKYADRVAYLIMSIICTFTIRELILYRRVIPLGVDAREEHIRTLRVRVRRGFNRFCRVLSRLMWLTIGVVTVCIALQFVPTLAEVSPPLAEISNWIVDKFNSLLEQGLAYIR
mgnify:CR=1 FL=1